MVDAASATARGQHCSSSRSCEASLSRALRSPSLFSSSRATVGLTLQDKDEWNKQTIVLECENLPTYLGSMCILLSGGQSEGGVSRVVTIILPCPQSHWLLTKAATKPGRVSSLRLSSTISQGSLLLVSFEFRADAWQQVLYIQLSHSGLQG